MGSVGTPGHTVHLPALSEGSPACSLSMNILPVAHGQRHSSGDSTLQVQPGNQGHTLRAAPWFHGSQWPLPSWIDLQICFKRFWWQKLQMCWGPFTRDTAIVSDTLLWVSLSRGVLWLELGLGWGGKDFTQPPTMVCCRSLVCAGHLSLVSAVLLFKCVFMALFFTWACETIIRSLSGLDLQFLFKASQMKWVFNHAMIMDCRMEQTEKTKQRADESKLRLAWTEKYGSAKSVLKACFLIKIFSSACMIFFLAATYLLWVIHYWQVARGLGLRVTVSWKSEILSLGFERSYLYLYVP